MQVKKREILAELPARLFSRKRFWLLAGVFTTSLLGVVAATAVVPQNPNDAAAVQSVVETLRPSIEALASPDSLPYVHDDRVKPGDTVSTIFRRLGIDDQAAIDFLLSTPEGKQAMRQLRAGHSVTAAIHPDGTMAELSLPIIQDGERLIIERNESSEFRLRKNTADTMTAVAEMRSGTIRSSLFGTADAIGMPDAVATKLADIFGTEIDFHTDLRRGDQFSVVYETLYDRGVPVRTGRVLAAEFINQGKRHLVVLYKNAEGREQYYTADGRSLRQGFLRSPLEFSRVTSNFGRRLHPIHKNWRTHAGVDFGAPTGTPVKATSDGTVEFVGNQNGYGNIIVLRHRGRYSTAYAHLNGFARNLKKGMSVDQGDVIGYVGSTGWATGAHLHYEVRINNEPKDPMRIALPTAEPLGPQELATFRTATAPMLERLALLSSYTQLAAAD